MYDRPSARELIEAVRQHLEAHVIPVIKGDAKLYFQSLVAANVLRIVERELVHGEAHAQHMWDGLNALENASRPAPASASALEQAITERNRALCAAIRAGDYDNETRRAALFAHLHNITLAQLEVANPRFLTTLAQEAQRGSND